MVAIMRKILVVDDNGDFRSFIKTVLTKAGYIVIEASDGVSAGDIYIKEMPDLVIMDLFLPVMDGVHAIHFLKDKYSDIKIIAITAAPSMGRTECLLKKAKEQGADIAIAKPINKEELLEKVNTLIGK